jgi:hypothetical protein
MPRPGALTELGTLECCAVDTTDQTVEQTTAEVRERPHSTAHALT